MPEPETSSREGMSFLDHLDELRSRLFRCAVAFVLVLGASWFVREPILHFLLRPVEKFGEIVFIHITEPFFIYMKACALVAIFVAAPYLLYQIWAFVAPGLYRHEKRWVVPFLFFGTLFFLGGGAFGYLVATPTAARWLIGLGEGFRATVTLRSAFQFESRIVMGMGLVFEMPILIFFLARIGLVTPAFLMHHFRTAVVLIAVAAAVITPTGDALTMSVFAGPMILLYLLGVGVSWLAERRDRR